MSPPAPAARVHAFDWLRGVAVVVMLQTHAIPLLEPELRSGPFFQRVTMIDGLVAPSFIFSAGFALALVQVRAGLAGRRREQATKTLQRLLEVLGVAALVNLAWFPGSPVKWLLRLDILHCIGLSLLLVLPLLLGLSTRPRVLRWVMLGLALALFLVAPLGEQVTGVGQLFLNTKPGVLDEALGAAFPLLPWAGYVFLGASFGATVGAMKHERELWQWLGLLLACGAVLWWQGPALRDAYPPHDFWVTNPADAARRWTQVLSLVALFRLVERAWPRVSQAAVMRWLAAFGGASLSAYFFHEMLLYQRWVGVFARLWRDRADWPTFWVLVAALIAATWACVKAWERVEPKLRARLTSWGAPPRPAS
jgi:uncharacterized membrane protein